MVGCVHAKSRIACDRRSDGWMEWLDGMLVPRCSAGKSKRHNFLDGKLTVASSSDLVGPASLGRSADETLSSTCLDP
jgi:hypothetical protein